MPTGIRPLPSPLSKELGRIINEEISARGESQRRIASRADMSPSQLSRACAGQKVFTIDQIDALCTVLELDIIDLITRATNATTNANDVALAASDDDDWQQRQEDENE